jgi:hypothetical protein
MAVRVYHLQVALVAIRQPQYVFQGGRAMDMVLGVADGLTVRVFVVVLVVVQDGTVVVVELQEIVLLRPVVVVVVHMSIQPLALLRQ